MLAHMKRYLAHCYGSRSLHEILSHYQVSGTAVSVSTASESQDDTSTTSAFVNMLNQIPTVLDRWYCQRFSQIVYLPCSSLQFLKIFCAL